MSLDQYYPLTSGYGYKKARSHWAMIGACKTNNNYESISYMDLTIKVKQPGRKHALINDKKIIVDDIGNHPVAKDLIAAVVRQQVSEYNSKPHEINLVSFLTDADTADQAATGKIGFGSIYNEEKVDATKAAAVAIQAFEDGLFALFINEDEVTDLNNSITLNPTTVITFIRLTFLAGSYW